MTEHPILFSGRLVRAILDGRKTQTRRVMRRQPEIGPLLVECKTCGRHKHLRGRSMAPETAQNLCDWECSGYSDEPYSSDLHPGESRGDFGFPTGWEGICPYGSLGDQLWVRETFHYGWVDDEWHYNDMEGYSQTESRWVRCDDRDEDRVWYAADGSPPKNDDVYDGWADEKTPSIFMPRWASRIQLEVTGIRIESLQDISMDDVRAEGVVMPAMPDEPGDDYPDPWEVFAGLWDGINAKRGYGWETNPWIWVVEFRRLDTTS